MGWQACYPMGKKAALTFSYDDGQVHDRRLVEILNRYGMKATFHLNYGTLDRDGFVTSGEVSTLYAGHEVACHGREHLHLTHLSQEQLIAELWEDRRGLERLTGCPVTGLSYPYGAHSEDVVQLIKALGFEYSRTTESTNNFSFPTDFLRWKPTCHHTDDIMGNAQRFLNPYKSARLQLFYVWGHSYEFARQDNWQVIEEFCKQTAFKEDIWYATNIEIKRYLCAVRALISDTEGKVLYNPSGVSVWVYAGELREILPGATVRLA